MEVEIVRKRIKNLHVGCYPPSGRVRVAAPEHVNAEAIKLAVLTRMQWIRRKQAQFLRQERQSPRRYISGETHYLFGRPMRLEVQEWDKKVYRIAAVANDRLRMNVPAGSEVAQYRKWMDAWLKSELRKTAAPRIRSTAMRLGLQPRKWGIRHMKTKWGSCNSEKGIVWLNAELVKKPERMLDYVISHELAHLASPRHDSTFITILDRELPHWRHIRRELNTLPLPAWTD